MWLIWCFDANDGKGDWLRELPSKVDDGGEAVLAFTSQLKARQRAAKHYGFDTYGEMRRAGWCEVRWHPPAKS